MIYNVFDLGDARAKDVMVPRVHVIFADVNSSYAELIDIFKEYKFTRLPIYEDTTDNVIGTINMKDLLLFENREHFQVRDILREAYFTYEYKNISELLVEMKDASLNIAIVLMNTARLPGSSLWKIFLRRSSERSMTNTMRTKKNLSHRSITANMWSKVRSVWMT